MLEQLVEAFLLMFSKDYKLGRIKYFVRMPIILTLDLHSLFSHVFILEKKQERQTKTGNTQTEYPWII